MRFGYTLFKHLLGGAFIFAGILHFANPGFCLDIMPPYLPWHEALVAISGVCEIVAGALVLYPPTVRIGAWAVLAVLMGIFPADVHMALNPITYDPFPAAAIYLRLPIQLVLIAWAFWFTIPAPEKARPALPEAS